MTFGELVSPIVHEWYVYGRPLKYMYVLTWLKAILINNEKK